MAQTGYTPISIYYSATATNTPTAGNLVAGELAINTADGKLFYKDSAGVVQTLASKDANSGSFTNLAYTGTLTGGTGVVNLGSGQVYKTSGGNVGIGTTSPTIKLVTIGEMGTQFSTNDSILKFGNNGTVASISATYGTTGSYVPIQFLTSDTERMRITSTGDVGIGSTATNRLNLTYDSGGGGATIGPNSTGGSTFLTLGTSNAGTYAERMRIDSSGNLLVGKTSSNTVVAGVNINPAGNGANVPLYNCSGNSVSGSDTTYQVYSTSSSSFKFYVTYAGVINAVNTSISGISDQRLKENIVDLDAGLDKVMALKPRKFDWKEGKGANTKNARGFIAQEFETVFPDLIDEWKDPAPEGEEPYKSVRADLIPVLVKAIQELNAKVDAQAAEIATLKDK